MIWIVAILFLMCLFNYLVKRANRVKSDFWVLVRKYPDLAQAWFEENDCWQIFDGEPAGGYDNHVPANSWAGPFKFVARDKATGAQFGAVVFGRHRDMAVSQAMFPKMIASVIGHYPRPKTNGLNLTLVVLTGALLVALLLGASDLDRWVIRDGSVACSDDEEAQFIQRSSNSGSLQYRIGKAVEDKKCFVVLANERVRIIELSTDGTRAKVHTQKQVEPQWMLTSDLKRASPGWLTLPWWPRAESISALSEVSHANNSPPLKEDGTCLLWEDAVRGDHIDECRRRMKLILPSQDVPVYVDPTPRLAPDGKCLDWNHAFRYRYMDTCRAAQAKRSGN